MMRHRSIQAKPALDVLEDRLLLSGNVTAFVSGGVLTITGDAQANGLVLEQGSSTTTFRLRPRDTTTRINGAVTARTFAGVSTVSINLRGGSDTLDILATTVPKGLFVNMGSGDNRLLVLGTNVKGTMRINSGLGIDTITLTNVNIAGPTDIISQGSGNITTVSGTFRTRLTFTGGSPTDRIDLVGATVTQAIRVSSPLVRVSGTARTLSGRSATLNQAGVTTTSRVFGAGNTAAAAASATSQQASIQTIFPVDTQTIFPVNTQTIFPVNTQTIFPVDTQTIFPVNTQTIFPVNTQTIFPVDTQTIFSADIQTIFPNTGLIGTN